MFMTIRYAVRLWLPQFFGAITFVSQRLTVVFCFVEGFPWFRCSRFVVPTGKVFSVSAKRLRCAEDSFRVLCRSALWFTRDF